MGRGNRRTRALEVEDPALKLNLTNVDAFHHTYLVRVLTSIKPIGQIVWAWNVGEWPNSIRRTGRDAHLHLHAEMVCPAHVAGVRLLSEPVPAGSNALTVLPEWQPRHRHHDAMPQTFDR